MVAEWPEPFFRKPLQRFLGFTDFYRLFIRDYSRIAAPLTKLTFPAVPFRWSPEAVQAFALLKDRFTSATILVKPDSSLQCVVEVDASDIAVGTGNN